MAKILVFTFENTKPKIHIDNNGQITGLIDNHEDLFDLISLLNNKLSLNLDGTDKIDLVRSAYEKATEGISESPDSYMELDLGDKTSFGLTDYIQNELEERILGHDSFQSYGELKDDVLEELMKNQSLDSLANLIDEINLVLISKTIELYNSHKASKVRLIDTIGLIRFQEMLSRELSNLGIDLEIN